MRVTPDTVEVAIVSFEGPDRYSSVGGLATRVTDLAPALAQRGYRVTHVFVGDPNLPPEATRHDGRVRLVRWGQWISRFHPRDVYDGEWGKWRDLSDNGPRWLLDHVVAPARQRGRRVVLLFEEWQTAEAAMRTGELSYVAGLGEARMQFWNANNTYGCWNIDFARLVLTTRVTTVSRWMRSELQAFGVRDALVIPNGISKRALAAVPLADRTALRDAVGDALLFAKVARFDRDKRWPNAVDAVTLLRQRGTPVRFLFRGSAAPHRDEVLARIDAHGLSRESVRLGSDATPSDLARAIQTSRAEALFLDFFLSERLLRALYAAADGVLANSEREPFGLVGLEVLGAGGVAYVGVTGEDYAEPLGNCVVVRTDDPLEVAEAALLLRERPGLAKRIRAEGRVTAKRYVWPRIIEDLELVWEYAAERSAGP